MKLIDLTFAVVARFVPMSPEDLRNLKQEANGWEQNLDSEKGNAVEKMYIKANDPWYFRLGYAVSYIFIIKAVKNWFYEDDAEPEVLDL